MFLATGRGASSRWWEKTPRRFSPRTLTVYVPDTDLNLGNPVATLVIPAVDQSEFDTVALLTKDNGCMDEIRYGASLQDVMIGTGAK